MARKRHHDPEPFTVVVGVAGIVGGLASVISLYRSFASVSSKTSHRQATAILERVVEDLIEIERRLEGMQQLAAQAIELEPHPTSLGVRLLLVPVQFAESTLATSIMSTNCCIDWNGCFRFFTMPISATCATSSI